MIYCHQSGLSSGKLPCPHCDYMIRDIEHIMVDCINIRNIREILIREIKHRNSEISGEGIKHLIGEVRKETVTEQWNYQGNIEHGCWENRQYKTEGEELIIWNEIVNWKVECRTPFLILVG